MSRATFTSDIDERIKELQFQLDGETKINTKIADTINSEFGTNYTNLQINSRRQTINGYKAKYRAENKEHIAEHNAKYRAENKERIAEHNAKYYAENKEYFTNYRAENKERYAEQAHNFVKRVYDVLVKHGNKVYADSLGMALDEFAQYKRNLGLTLDHIIPISRPYLNSMWLWFGGKYNYWSDLPERIQKKLDDRYNNLENLQLIPMGENQAKRTKEYTKNVTRGGNTC